MKNFVLILAVLLAPLFLNAQLTSSPLQGQSLMAKKSKSPLKLTQEERSEDEEEGGDESDEYEEDEYEEEERREDSDDRINKFVKKLNRGQKFRENNKHNLIAGYSFLESWVPGKLIFAYGYNSSSEATWELEYTRGSINFDFVIADLGKITEQRITLLRRSYSKRNSFNLFYGLHYYSLEAYLGDDLADSLVGTGKLDLISISNIGVTLGLGNRWQLGQNFAMGFDWFALYIPVFNKKSSAPALTASSDPNDVSDIRDVLDTLESFPTFSTLRFQLGYAF